MFLKIKHLLQSLFFLFVYMSSSITDGTPSVVSQIIHDGA